LKGLVAWISAGCIAAALAACGGDSDRAPATIDGEAAIDAQFVTRLGELCERRQGDFLAATDVSLDTDPASARDRANAALEAQEPFVKAIMHLDVPTGKAVEYSNFVDNRVELLENTEETIEALEGGDEKGIAAVRSEREPLIVQDRARSEALGVAPCVGELDPEDERAINVAIASDATTADPEACSKIYTDFYLATFGGKGEESVANCEEVAGDYKPADSIDVEIDGFTGEAFATVTQHGGQNDGKVFVYALREVDGDWLINEVVLSKPE